MKRISFLSVLCLFFVCTGCSNKDQQSVRTYDLLNVTEETDLKFSDLVDEVRIVPLETSNSILVDDSRYVINDKYIITLGEKTIRQFDAASGKHIRLLAVAGNGPLEYRGINSAAIRNGKLFYNSPGKNMVSVIDLESGTFLQPLPTTYKFSANFAGVSDQEEIYVVNDSLLFETFNFSTQKSTPVFDTPRKVKAHSAYTFSFEGMPLSGHALQESADGIFLYNANFSDTLYLKKGADIEPYAVFIIPGNTTSNDPAAEAANRTDILMGIPYLDSRVILCGFRELDTKMSENTLSVNIESKGLYYIDRQTGEAKKLNKYIFDPLFVTEFPRTSTNLEEGIGETLLSGLGDLMGNNMFADKHIYARVFPAYKVKMYIKESLEDPDFPKEKVAAELQILDSKLTEESNPVVFIGKKK